MDYEKKYKEALERARNWKEKSGMPKDRQCILDDIFPELKESEDGRIIKHIISVLEDCWQTCKNIDYEQYIYFFNKEGRSR